MVRLLVQADERLNSCTSATVSQLLEKHFALLEVERMIKATYEKRVARHAAFATWNGC